MQSQQSVTGAEEREFRFTQKDFERVRALVYQHAGINLKPNKVHMVYSRLVRRLRARKAETFSDYLNLVESDEGEWEKFVNALTTNLTYFFREQHHFEILAGHVKSLTAAAPKRQLKIWCAAASTGEEAYSLAMTMVEVFGTFSAPVRILATDLDTQVLERAEKGIYALERVEKLAPERLKRFFLEGQGDYRGFVRVRPELQALVAFGRLNLKEERWPLRGPFDAIFCRNVMIYFDKATQYRVLEKFVPLLAPDGLLFAGHSESFHHAADLFRMRGKTVYGLAKK